GHSAVWSSKPARGKLERWDISDGIELATALDRIERGEAVITNSELPENLEKILAWVEKNNVSLATPGRKVPEKKPGVLFVGLQIAVAKASALQQ
ncbi:MAG TPA: hypothetical protein VG711_08995, partial [Phycisphaerales bacterium]|nr:hypothetical protein [Phycisphaerales bacterium]